MAFKMECKDHKSLTFSKSGLQLWAKSSQHALLDHAPVQIMGRASLAKVSCCTVFISPTKEKERLRWHKVKVF